MKRLWKAGAVAALLGVSCGGAERLYDNNDLQLVTAYSAKDACSCLFVMEQTEDYCRDWTRANPNVAHLTIDRAEKKVTSAALLLWASTSRYVDEVVGCQPED